MEVGRSFVSQQYRGPLCGSCGHECKIMLLLLFQELSPTDLCGALLSLTDTKPSSCVCSQIAETYSIVCKSQKKKPMENNGSKTLPRSFGGDRNASRGRGRGVQGQARSQEEPGYEPVGDRSWSTCAMADPDPAYATIDAHRKREQAGANNSTTTGSTTLKRKKQMAQQQQVAPAAPQGSDPPAVRGLPGGENFYETISDVKPGASSSGTTTIFTFNDGMEMYVTGL